MNRRQALGVGIAAAALPILRGAGRAAEDRPIAIERARVHVGDGTKIDPGTVLLRGREIVAVGSAANVMVPGDAARIDGAGLWVTPGLFDAESMTGLADVFLEASTVEAGLDERYDAIRPAFSVLDGWNPRAIALAVTRIEGVTTTALVPRGGLVAGRGAIVRLHGQTAEEMTVRPVSGVYVNLAAEGRAAAFGARGGQLLRLRELFDDVRQFRARRADFEKNQMRKVAASRLDLEALIPVLDGAAPLVVEAHRASDILAALRFAGQLKVPLVLSGAEEGWIVARQIADAGAPVVLSALPNLPRSFEALGARLENAAILARAGVKVAISPREAGYHTSRTLRLEAGNAVANGLPWETALGGITSRPAEIFGVDDIGQLVSGKSADLVVWSGDPFEPLTRPRHVFVAGREIPLVSRQTELRDRYRDLKGARPRP